MPIYEKEECDFKGKNGLLQSRKKSSNLTSGIWGAIFILFHRFSIQTRKQLLGKRKGKVGLFLKVFKSLSSFLKDLFSRLIWGNRSCSIG